MSFTTLFFDLDDTLYPSDNGLWAAIRERMNEYMLTRLQIPADQVPLLRRHYFETYGTTLRGLMTHYAVDADDFLAFVHDLPVESIVRPDPELRPLLMSLPQPKFIFTNADTRHARRVLNVLNLNGCFEQIIDVNAMNFFCKPDPHAYRTALALARESDARCCVYLDDSTRNLAPAHQMGFFTVLVGSLAHDGVPADHAADRSIRSLHELPAAVPELWRAPFQSETPQDE